MSRPNREFDPHPHMAGEPSTITLPSGLIYYNDRTMHLTLASYALSSVPSNIPGSVVVYIDGTSREEGTAAAVAAYALYFGPQCPRNEAALLPASETQSIEAAEIYAANMALKKIKESMITTPISQILIISDSDNLINGISSSNCIWTWVVNGWKNEFDLPVENASLFKRLHDRTLAFERKDVLVQFWRVPRDCNEEAAKWAMEGLQGESGMVLGSEGWSGENDNFLVRGDVDGNDSVGEGGGVKKGKGREKGF